MLRVGLTGGIGSGKTAVSRLLEEHGATVIDADVLAREVVAPGTPGHAAVLAEFGTGIEDGDGAIDRAALGRLVFGDAEARGRLEAIVHPLVRSRGAEIEQEAPPDAVVVHVIPLLVETGQADRFDRVVVVDVPEEVQVARLVADRGMSVEDAKARITAQASRDERLDAADMIVDNSGDRGSLADRVERLWDVLRRAAAAV